MSRTLGLALMALTLLAVPAGAALDPSEVLEDPALEARARGLSAELRCMVCQNQSIDDSNAELARDLRVLVRERILAGDSDAEVIDYVVSRYGEFVLLRPPFSMRNAALWASPVLLILGGGGFIFFATRNRRRQEVAKLSEEEDRKLKELLERG
ncbi:MAG: cytochrome c-type biogenesis protein CcmH [Mesorhizobium sp.]|nr:cytochrome c-type biogenesis protein CcmH [Mesorhizobium sp.]